MSEIVGDFAAAFKAVDESAPKGRSRTREYQAGIGPLTEDEAVARALVLLRQRKPIYTEACARAYPSSRQKCDIVLPGLWAIESKLIRRFGDNGVEAEHWSENLLHPYAGNVSSIGDAMKLNHSVFKERKGILIFGYEHCPARINLDNTVRCFEEICSTVVGIRLGDRCSAEFANLIHPCHQHGKVFGWEVIQ